MALPQSIRKCWHDLSDLTIYDAAFWMLHESDPELHRYRCECDAEFASNYSDNPNGEEAVYETGKIISSAIRSKIINTTKQQLTGSSFDITNTYILKSDWISWCLGNGYTALSSLFAQHINTTTPADFSKSSAKAVEISTAIKPHIPISPATTTSITSDAPQSTTHKLNRNILDPAIDQAIKLAGNMELADVFLKLKEMALNNYLPFTGATGNKTLSYTDDNNIPKDFSKNALGKRLIIRKSKAV